MRHFTHAYLLSQKLNSHFYVLSSITLLLSLNITSFSVVQEECLPFLTESLILCDLRDKGVKVSLEITKLSHLKCLDSSSCFEIVTS